jgi:hypothetical protein|tara:strand:+ start:1108 stop:1212 length:105 start_codon:yes stop_codon:yes gene_type:complete
MFIFKLIEWVVKLCESETDWDRIQREKREREEKK